jgi:GNAT superfamily N-acetyltransferase
VIVRRARRADVPAIVGLLQDDSLGSTREAPKGAPLPDSYFAAFDAIDRDRNSELVVAEEGGRVVGSFQMTILTHLSYRGSRSAQLENVHVAAGQRGRGVGREMIAWAIARARRLGCARVQLTTNKIRKDAHRFYERLGFRSTHEGMKLILPET